MSRRVRMRVLNYLFSGVRNVEITNYFLSQMLKGSFSSDKSFSYLALSAVCASRSSPSDCVKAPTSGSSLALKRRPRKQLELARQNHHPPSLAISLL